MITPQMRWLTIAVAIFMFFVAAPKNLRAAGSEDDPDPFGSHFRGAAMVPSVDASGLLTVETTNFWRPTSVSSAFPSVSGVGNMTQISNVLDTSDIRFTKRVQVHQRQLPGPGTYNISWSSCCRISGIRNSSASGWTMNSRIFWDGNTANSPIQFNFSAVQPSVPRGIDYNGNLGAVTGPGNSGTLTYDQALNTGISSQPPGFTIDPNTGALFIPAANTATYLDNSLNRPGREEGGDYAFSGNIFNSDGSSVEFDWLFDAGPIIGGPPVANDFALTVGCGEVVNHTFTATDPDNDPLTWSFVGLSGPGVNLPPTFDPNTQAFAWDTTDSTLGQYSAQVLVTDLTSLTDIGILTIDIAGFPCAGDDNTSSLGSFKIAVKPQFHAALAGVPGFNPGTGILTSPRLFDRNTVIGRSDPHEDGDASATSGTPVGEAGTIIGDGDFALIPASFEGPPGTREVHTEIRQLNMTGGGMTLRAGSFYGLPVSAGEVESKSGASGDPSQDFPAESFFNMFVEIDAPGLGTLFNSDPLLVENDNLTKFPPKVVYIHGNTNAVPILFKDSNPPNWNAGDCFGFLVLAGHGVSFDVNVPADVAQFDEVVENLPDGTPRPLLPVGFPGQGDDQVFSMGLFRIAVKDAFQPLLQGVPGFDSATGRLTSPVLRDRNTIIGRSAPHLDGDASDTGGTPVGTLGTLISDSDYPTIPNQGFTEGPPGTREVHTQIVSLNLTDTGVAVRAGIHAPDQPISPGEVESKSGASGDPTHDFPAESFFNVFVEIDLPGVGLFPGGTLFNSDALVIVSDNVTKFPPRVVYIHGNTNAVPVFFKSSDAGGLWNAGDCFGWLVLAGHGVGFNPDNSNDVQEVIDQTTKLPDGTPRPELPIIPIGGDPADLRAVEYSQVNIVLNFPMLETEVKVRMENLGPGDAANVTAKIASCGPNCIIVDGDVTLGNIPVGGSAWSADTYKLSYNLLAGVVDQGITWDITYVDTGGTTRTISGVPELPAAAPAAVPVPNLVPETMAYQNYPNSFNPETWIPYQLAQAAEVTIGIYSSSGQLIRNLNLGLQQSGFYISRDKAAYWNGRNEFGEKVVSGIYFYVLQAGDYQTVKKMYLLK